MSEPSTTLDHDDLAAENAELRRLLTKHQWSGLTPLKSAGVCPECCGSSRTGHRPGCPLRAAIETPVSV